MCIRDRISEADTEEAGARRNESDDAEAAGELDDAGEHGAQSLSLIHI